MDAVRGVVAVSTRHPGTIVLLSERSGRIVGRVGFPGEARHLALATPDGPLLIPSEPVNRLFTLALDSRGLTSIPVGRHPHAAESVDGRIFVGNELGDSVSVISAGKVAGRAAGFAQPGGLAGVGGDVAVVDVRAYTLTLIDGRTLRPLGTQPAGAGPTHAVGDRAGHIFVVDTRGNAVESFAAFPRLRLRARVALNGTPYGVALDSRRGRLWVTLTATNQLAELAVDGGAPRLLAVYSTGRQPNTVAVDPVTGTVFVADAGDGAVEIIRPRLVGAVAHRRPTGP